MKRTASSAENMFSPVEERSKRRKSNAEERKTSETFTSQPQYENARLAQ